MVLAAVCSLWWLAACAGPSAEATGVAPETLEGTAWTLVQIQSMDDTTTVPDDPAKYTLEFLPEGRAAMRADCNRGSGSWSSERPGQLRFGPIAATRAMCPPGSIDNTYLAQFEWVRSYVFSDGHLFLATMADGAIIEFAPAGPTP
jgi:heat shock protein HslJ